jgi:hypothetical protein
MNKEGLEKVKELEEISNQKNKIKKLQITKYIDENDKDNFFNKKIHPFGYEVSINCECRTCREYFLNLSLLEKIKLNK